MEATNIKETLIRSILQAPSQKAHKKPAEMKEAEPATAESIKEITIAQDEVVKNLSESLNEFMKSVGYSLQFIPDREAGVVVIKVLDGEGRVVRQIPPEAVLALSSKIGENIGVFINSKL